MTIFRSDRAPPEVLASVRALLLPLTDALGLGGLGLLPSTLLPQGYSFEITGGSRGRGQDQRACRWLALRSPQHRDVDRAWAEPGWSLGALVLTLQSRVNPQIWSWRAVSPVSAATSREL